jgi:hypothetical protein
MIRFAPSFNNHYFLIQRKKILTKYVLTVNFFQKLAEWSATADR